MSEQCLSSVDAKSDETRQKSKDKNRKVNWKESRRIANNKVLYGKFFVSFCLLRRENWLTCSDDVGIGSGFTSCPTSKKKSTLMPPNQTDTAQSTHHIPLTLVASKQMVKVKTRLQQEKMKTKERNAKTFVCFRGEFIYLVFPCILWSFSHLFLSVILDLIILVRGHSIFFLLVARKFRRELFNDDVYRHV